MFDQDSSYTINGYYNKDFMRTDQTSVVVQETHADISETDKYKLKLLMTLKDSTIPLPASVYS